MRRYLVRPVVVPGRHTYSQAELAEVMRGRLATLEGAGAASMRKMVGFVYEHSTIEQRHIEISLAELGSRRGWYPLVNQATLSLAQRSIEQLVSQGHPIDGFDALVCVSASFAGFPALSRLLQDKLGIPLDAKCYDLTGLGCAGPTHGLQLADMLVTTGAAKRVCVVCADVMGTHGESRVHERVPDMSQLVAHCLASDGGAATIVSAEPLADDVLSWDRCALDSKLWPGTLAENDFTADEDNQPLIAVGKEIRTRLLPELGPVMDSIDPASSYFHPGGAALMATLSSTYPAFQPTLEISSNVMRQHGNIGAASVLWVLHDAWAGGRRFTDELRLIALGPGIVATMIHFSGLQHTAGSTCTTS